jgi:hypothetical protein
MVNLSLPALGYTRFNTDAGWELFTFPNGTKRPCAARGPDNMLLADPAKFPNGLGPVAEHVNKLGLQWGMYLPFHACPATGPTKFDHPAADIKLCTQLNATLVKVDALQFTDSPADTQAQMVAFQTAINESTTPQMFFSNVRLLFSSSLQLYLVWFCMRPVHSHSQDSLLTPFLASFLYRNDHFTKTGSGQA